MLNSLRSSVLLSARSALRSQQVYGFASVADDFASAQSRVKQLKEDPGNEAKLKLYALFKQAESGKVTSKRPGMMDFVGRAKWDAWNALGDISKEEAMKQYIAYVDSLAAGGQGGSAASSTPSKPAPTVAVNSGSKFIEATKSGRVYTIKINRPEKKNALTIEMYDAIVDSMKIAGDDPDSSVTVICAEGNDYFCSGNDLSMFLLAMDKGIEVMAKESKELFERYINAWIKHPKLLVVLVNGPAVGVAVTVLGLADVVYASDKATFHTPFPALGQSPEGCSSYTFPLLMGNGAASEMLLLGTKINAEKALRYNLVTQVFPDATFREDALNKVAAYAKLPPKTLCISKNLIKSWDREKLLKINAIEAEQLRQTWLAEECQQAIMSFFSKKK